MRGKLSCALLNSPNDRLALLARDPPAVSVELKNEREGAVVRRDRDPHGLFRWDNAQINSLVADVSRAPEAPGCKPRRSTLDKGADRRRCASTAGGRSDSTTRLRGQARRHGRGRLKA